MSLALRRSHTEPKLDRTMKPVLTVLPLVDQTEERREPGKFVGVAELAKITGLDPSTIQQHSSSGVFRYTVVGGDTLEIPVIRVQNKQGMQVIRFPEDIVRRLQTELANSDDFVTTADLGCLIGLSEVTVRKRQDGKKFSYELLDGRTIELEVHRTTTGDNAPIAFLKSQVDVLVGEIEAQKKKYILLVDMPNELAKRRVEVKRDPLYRLFADTTDGKATLHPVTIKIGEEEHTLELSDSSRGIAGKKPRFYMERIKFELLSKWLAEDQERKTGWVKLCEFSVELGLNEKTLIGKYKYRFPSLKRHSFGAGTGRGYYISRADADAFRRSFTQVYSAPAYVPFFDTMINLGYTRFECKKGLLVVGNTIWFQFHDCNDCSRRVRVYKNAQKRYWIRAEDLKNIKNEAACGQNGVYCDMEAAARALNWRKVTLGNHLREGIVEIPISSRNFAIPTIMHGRERWISTAGILEYHRSESPEFDRYINDLKNGDLILHGVRNIRIHVGSQRVKIRKNHLDLLTFFKFLNFEPRYSAQKAVEEFLSGLERKDYVGDDVDIAKLCMVRQYYMQHADGSDFYGRLEQIFKMQQVRVLLEKRVSGSEFFVEVG